MTRTRSALAPSIAALVALSSLLACSSRHAAPARSAASPPAAPAARPTSPPFESSVPEQSPAAVRAQHAWCSYLEELYHRATGTGAPWAELARCNAHVSTAAPEMLERTALCSHKALADFHGDPFTDAYAAEVRRCGTTVIDALELTPDEVEPIVVLICDRAAECGQSEEADCLTDVTARLGSRIARAVGTINSESRVAFRRCLATSGCAGAEERITRCLDPIMDRLLWTPG